MTSSDKENLERKLNHVLDMGQMLADQYRHITCTERTALMLALLAAVKQVSCNVATVRELLSTYIVDTFRVDYQDYAWKFKTLHEMLKNKLAGAPMVNTLDTSQRPVVGTDSIVAHENNLYHISDCKNIERLPQIQTYLISHATNLNDEVLDGIQLIIADLEGIGNDYYRMLDNEAILDEAFQNLQAKYDEMVTGEEQDEMGELAARLDYYMQRHGSGSRQLTHFIQTYKQDCGELADCYFQGFSPARVLLQRRDRFTFNDVWQFFYQIKGYGILQDMAGKVAAAEAQDTYAKAKRGDVVINMLGGRYIENEYNYYK